MVFLRWMITMLKLGYWSFIILYLLQYCISTFIISNPFSLVIITPFCFPQPPKKIYLCIAGMKYRDSQKGGVNQYEIWNQMISEIT